MDVEIAIYKSKISHLPLCVHRYFKNIFNDDNYTFE